MINKYILTPGIFALFLLSGCGQPVPNMGNGSSNISSADTVSIDESRYGGSSGSGSAGGGVYNSSADGFQSLYFDFDDYTISPDMQRIVINDASVARKAAGQKIRVEGNCDEFGTDEYNYALGLKRAKAVKDSLVMQGVPASQMVMISYGESNPACTAQTDACYAQNRRVDLRLAR
jgi:peptidoglycan-associated lipoprotein